MSITYFYDKGDEESRAIMENILREGGLDFNSEPYGWELFTFNTPYHPYLRIEISGLGVFRADLKNFTDSSKLYRCVTEFHPYYKNLKGSVYDR